MGKACWKFQPCPLPTIRAGEYPLVPELCLGTHSGGKLSLLFGGKETEFPGHLRAQTEFGHEE